MITLISLNLGLYIALVLYGAWTDMRHLRIANWVSMGLLAAFICMAVLVGLSWETIGLHAAAGALTLVIGFGLFAFGYFGGGDAKLMAACALWVGWENLLFFTLAVLLVGGVLSVLVVILRKGIGLWPDWLVRNAEGLFVPNKAVPYGIAIAAGAMIVLPRMALLPGHWHTIIEKIF